jgi:DNA invertase Pin-like site-specific DNA recombinase
VIKMAIVGYARVSSIGQSLEVQLDVLNGYGVDVVYSEKQSATSTNQRHELKRCLDYVREGDTLVITKLDRLARSTFDLTNITKQLEDDGVDLVVIEQQIDTSTTTGRLLFGMLGVIAQFETEIRKERQLAGIAKALENGVKFGAKSKLSEEQVVEMVADRNKGMLIRECANKYSLSNDSVYRLIRGYKKNQIAV